MKNGKDLASKAKLTADAAHDLLRIAQFLTKVHHERFSHDLASAAQMAWDRVERIQANIDRIESAPFVGAKYESRYRSYRHVTIERAIYCYRIDKTTETITIDAIFFGGQDHFQRFLGRLRSDGETG